MDQRERRLLALRGATTVARNEPGDVIAATQELLETMLERNGVGPADIVSMIFTATQDLDAEFPAVAARRIALTDAALLCAVEMAVPGALPRCIRVLIHLYSARDYSSLEHVYLRGARALRTDLP